MIFTLANAPWVQLEWVGITNAMLSMLLRCIYEFVSMRRYSAPGLYIIIGRYRLCPSTAIAKSDIALHRFELLPILAKASLFEPTFLGGDVCVEVRGSRDEANMTESTRFHRAIVDTSRTVSP